MLPSESDPNLSLGGVISSVQILSQTATPSGGQISGVTVDDAYGNDLGTAAALHFINATTGLTWEHDGSGVGDEIDVSSDGQYTILAADKKGALIVTIVSASLPGGDTDKDHTITALKNKLFDDIANTEALAGDVEYRCFYIINSDGTDAFDAIAVFVNEQPTGDATVKLGLDPAGINGTATTIVDESTRALLRSGSVGGLLHSKGQPLALLYSKRMY